MPFQEWPVRRHCVSSLAPGFNQIEHANKDELLLILPTKFDIGGSAAKRIKEGSTDAHGTDNFPGRVKDTAVNEEEKSV